MPHGVEKHYTNLGFTGEKTLVTTAGNTSARPGIFSSPPVTSDTIRAIQAMVEAGVNLIDIAGSYAEGESEEFLGLKEKHINHGIRALGMGFWKEYIHFCQIFQILMIQGLVTGSCLRQAIQTHVGLQSAEGNS